MTRSHFPDRADPGTLRDEITSRVRSLAKTDTDTVRQLRREFSKSLRASDGRDIVALADRLLDSADFTFRFVAYELVLHHPTAGEYLDTQSVVRLGRGLDSWAAVDCFCCYIAGPAWRTGRVSDSLILRWARAQDRWWRRAALVSTVPLNSKTQGGVGDAGRTLTVCRTLVADRDDMVVKAMSWALRELAKRDRAAVEAFLWEQTESLAARVVREVRNKLDTGRKNPKAK